MKINIPSIWLIGWSWNVVLNCSNAVNIQRTHYTQFDIKINVYLIFQHWMQFEIHGRVYIKPYPSVNSHNQEMCGGRPFAFESWDQ